MAYVFGASPLASLGKPWHDKLISNSYCESAGIDNDEVTPSTANYTNNRLNLDIYLFITQAQPFYSPLGFCQGLSGEAGTRKIKPIWI